jgi:hypothetical protein
VVQPKSLRFATSTPWYVSDRQIHEDLGIPFFADHIRALTDCFNSKLAYAGNPLISETWKALVPTKGRLKSLTGYRGGLMLSKPAEAVPKKKTKSAQRVMSNYSDTLTGVSVFLSVVRQM